MKGYYCHLWKNISWLAPLKDLVSSTLSGNGDNRKTTAISHCLFVLRFYGPVKPMGSCRARSVYLTIRLLGRLSPLSG